MQNVDSLIHARWIIPIRPKGVVLEHHSLAILQGNIVAILPTHEAKNQFQAQTTVELSHQVLMPGLVNAHAHTPMNLFRGLADDLKLMDWLQHHIWPAEKDLINAESVALGSKIAIAEMLRGGITCFNDNYFFPDVTAQAAIDAGMRAALGNVIMSVPTQWASTEAEYFKRAETILSQQKKHPLIQWMLCPHAPYTVSDSALQQTKELADAHHIRIHMHLHETQYEVEDGVRIHGKRPFQRIDEAGLLSPQFIAIHMVHLNEHEIKRMQETGSHMVHCPESNLKLASGFAPVSALQAQGVNVALGTDGAASNNDLDMWGEMRIASFLAKALTQDPTALPAWDALEMVTLNGARALGWEDTIGSLEVGKAADCIAVDLGDFLAQPLYEPTSQLVYATNRLQVTDVWVHGKQLLKAKEWTTLDIPQLSAQLNRWQTKAAPYAANKVSTAAHKAAHQ